MAFGKVSPGHYTLAATFVDPTQNLYDFVTLDLPPFDLVSEQAEMVLVELDLLYREVQFVGHCLLTIAEQVWVDPDWKSKYRGMATEALDITARVTFLKEVIAGSSCHR